MFDVDQTNLGIEVAGDNVTEAEAAVVCFYSHNVGLAFSSENSIAKNKFLAEHIGKLPENEVSGENGMVYFHIDTHHLAHFLHMVYCHTPEGLKLQADFDGVYQFEAPDMSGVMQRFNAQLVTISEQPA